MKSFMNLFKKKVEEPKEQRKIFTTDFYSDRKYDYQMKIDENLRNLFQPVKQSHMAAGVMDQVSALKLPFFGANIPQSLLGWYSNNTFIGWQNSAMIAQHWLVSKACLMPAQDAMRKGYEITSNDGSEIDAEVMDAIRHGDVSYNINHNLVELIQMGRVFGIRIAMFVIDVDDPQEFYANPFNIDAVPPNSYRGITQIDPYWITPQLDGDAAGNPGAIDFYEPTWWKITGMLVHRTHLIIYRTEEVADILKPSYIYGGVPIPQKIYERVYAAERTANEAPMLCMTKRMNVVKTDMSQALANQGVFEQRIAARIANRDNYGVMTIDETEEYQQTDTSLAELDAVIMTQYQLVAAASNVPATKLLGTSPKGFHSTGEFEEANYHEFLESLQETGMTQLVERHHQIMIMSDIAPKFGVSPFCTTIQWNELDAMTAKEQAEVNKLKAESGQTLINSGAIDNMEERKRVINDKSSGYNGLIDDEDIPNNQSEPGELENA